MQAKRGSPLAASVNADGTGYEKRLLVAHLGYVRWLVAIAIRSGSRNPSRPFPTDCYLPIRPVRSESATTLRYLAPVSLDQPDFGNRRHGQKTLLACRQFDCTRGIVAPSFAPSVDVTGAANGRTQSRVDRSRRSEFASGFGGFEVSDRSIDRPDEPDSGRALLSVWLRSMIRQAWPPAGSLSGICSLFDCAV